MKTGDLVSVVNPKTLPGIEVGDLAILVEIDWQCPDGIISSEGVLIKGRGYFFFPNKPELNIRWGQGGRIGPMLTFNNFEVISEAR